MSVDHYENFPVASVLLPARLRPAVETIYWFARSADDLADEGEMPPEDRLAALCGYEKALDELERDGSANTPLFEALGQVIRKFRVPLQPLRDLLSAFRQDVVTTRYSDIHALLDYCRRSANPVGRLMLHLYNETDPDKLRQSDAICSALQLINFLQDVSIDWKKQRIYIPQDDMKRFGVSENHLQDAITDASWRRLMQFEVSRAREMMLSGAPLALALPGRVGWELRLVVQGGLRILERIEAVGYDVFHKRPQLGAKDWLTMLWRASRMKFSLARTAHVG